MKSAQSTLAQKLAAPEARAQKVNQMYDKQFGGHGSGRHGAGTTTAQHQQRVLTGALPDGESGRAVRSSSHYDSQQTQLAARHAAQNSFRDNERTGRDQPASGRNLTFSPDLGDKPTGTSATRVGSVRNARGTTTESVSGAQVVLRQDGGYLTDYPQPKPRRSE